PSNWAGILPFCRQSGAYGPPIWGMSVKEIIEAANGEEAIAQIGSSRAQLVIMDWKMDVMDGLECTRRIRAGTDGIDPKLPIILLTGMTGSDSEGDAYEAGVDLFMEKPFSIKKLHAGVVKILGAG
ncbi:response regulator, partial [Magnetospirillum moscoviense]